MITKTCEICACLFDVSPYRESTARFCSKKCGGVWHAKTRLPSVVSESMKGNNYRLGKRPANSFKKGHKPWNAGIKGTHFSPSTEFEKGCKSLKKLPVGSVRIRNTKGGHKRAFVKTADPSMWKIRASAVWESSFGAVPKGYVLHHHDRNPLNDDITNLRCLSRAAHINVHRDDLKGR